MLHADLIPPAEVADIFARLKSAATFQDADAPGRDELRHEVRAMWRQIKPFVARQGACHV
jgi:hypothetical protein